MRADAEVRPADGAATTPAPRPASGALFLLLVAAFAAYAFIPSGLSAHLLGILQRAGIDAGTAVFIGTLFGPAQVAARLCEFIFARNVHPLWLARFAVGLLLSAFAMLWWLGISAPTGMAFAVMFGAANGLITIARGRCRCVEQQVGYGAPSAASRGLVVTAVAPVVVAFVASGLGRGCARVAAAFALP